jgi:hypothetical protein
MSKRIKPTVPAEIIERRIYLIRSHKVMLDSDLAELYKVDTRVLNQAVNRNLDRFPEDFMFQLTANEDEALRSQIVTLKSGRGRHRKYYPHVFTEQGVAMLSSVLKSPRAVQVNVAIMRVFVRIRTLMASHTDLIRRLDEMEKKYDKQFRVVFDAIRELMTPEPVPPKNRIGFTPQEDG